MKPLRQRKGNRKITSGLCSLIKKEKLLPDTKQQVKEISLISQGQFTFVLRRLGISRCRCVRSCQSPLEGAGIGRAPEGGGSLGASHGV